jgi:biotin transporter BioY
MMQTSFIALIVAVVFVLSIGVFYVVRNRGIETRVDDYRTFFIMGVAFIPIGIATDNYAFSIIGLVFIILGVTNRDKWRNTQEKVEKRAL